MNRTRPRTTVGALAQRCLALLLSLLLALPSPTALAGLVIPQVPVLGASTSPYAPNLMILLDNSSSMLMEMMPAQDSGYPWGTGNGTAYDQIGLYSPQCNSLFFNPNQTYPVPPTPVDPTGANTYPALPVPSVHASPIDGYAAYLANPANPSQTGWAPSYANYGLNVTNWTQSPQPAVAYNPAATQDLINQPFSLIVSPQGYQSRPLPTAGYFLWVSGVNLQTGVSMSAPAQAACLTSWVSLNIGGAGNLFYLPPNQVQSAQMVSGHQWDTFWWIPVSSMDAAGQANYANWFSYYRSRMNVMKAALGTSLGSTLTNGLRAGLLTTTTTPINGSTNVVTTPGETWSTPVGSYAFKAPTVLNASGQASLIAKAYGQAVPMNSFTYLNVGLSRLGQYYAGLRSAGGLATRWYTNGILDTTGNQPDPMQASCQRNYALMVTDGLYNDYSYGRNMISGLSNGSTWGISYDTPPGEPVTYVGGTVYAGLVNARDSVGWSRPFASPQAYKPFDDSEGKVFVNCEPNLSNMPGGYDTFHDGPNAFVPNVGTGKTYQSYVLNQAGQEVALSNNPMVVPMPGWGIGTWSYTNTAVTELWYASNTYTGMATQLVAQQQTLSVPGNAGDCPRQDASGNCYYDVPMNYAVNQITSTTCSASGEGIGAGTCTTVTTPATTVGSSCMIVRWVDVNNLTDQMVTAATPAPATGSLSSRYTYRQWPSFQGCTGQQVDYQLVCSGSIADPNTGQLASVYYRVPGLTHDRSTNLPIHYSYTRSQGQSTTPSATIGGVTGNLADIAMYYYDTDLRPTMPDNLPVPAAGASPLSDTNRFQHMTTYVMGLGVSGYLNYQSDYAVNPATTSDWPALIAGTRNWPNWAWAGLSNGADPRIDDLWHTAVNGHGRYYAVNNLADINTGLINMIGSVVSVPVFGAAAGADQLNLSGNGVAFTNFFTAYWPTFWSGDLLVTPSTIDATQGTPINGSAAPVSASASLRTRIGYDANSGLWCDNRNLLLMAGSSAYDLRWDTPVVSGSGCAPGATGTRLPGSVGSVNVTTSLDATTSDKGFVGAASGDLVNWIRGSRAREVSTPLQAGQLFRYRVDDKANFMPLGDIVDGQPVYVAAPVFSYAENNYAAFKAANRNRAARVYLAANDGMLHAFNPDPASGVMETWALMPSSVVPEVYRTASPSYAGVHRFLLDGPPVSADVYDATNRRWRTIVVGGMRGGGSDSGTSGFYAVDVTDPTGNPTPLWEFRRNAADASCSGSNDLSNPASGLYEACQLGFSYSTPVITKLVTGQWVVLLASGYNNRDGKGHLYVLDAVTGAQVARLDNNWNGQDSGSAPESGFAQLSAWIANPTMDNTALLAYGGDLNGNVWRYDLRTPANTASMNPTLLAKLTDANGKGQPVTTVPEMQTAITGAPMVFVGTGQLFGDADRASTQTHTFYGLADSTVQSSTQPNALTRSDLVQLTVAGNTINVNGNALSTKGYALDLPGTAAGAGTATERVLITPQIIGGNLIFVTNAPSNDPCVAGGVSWLYTLNAQTGLPAAGVGQPARTQLSISAVGLGVYLVGNQPVAQVTGANLTASAPLPNMVQPFAGRRAAWREVRP